MKRTEFEKYAVRHLGLNSLTLSDYTNEVSRMAVPRVPGVASQPIVNEGGWVSPTIIEERQLNVATMDVFSRLMMDRIIFLGAAIGDEVANIIQAQLLFLESSDSSRDVTIYLNSPGGSVSAGMGIYDTMQLVRPDIITICTGLAASMGAILLTAGQTGKRSILPHARVMIHQPLGGAHGQAADIEITAREIVRARRELYEIIAHHTGQPIEKIERDGDRDYWMSATEAVEYGIVDDVVARRK
jgi:ATP-dependent Clp protease protease subunit